MIFIIDNGGCYSDHAIHFVSVPDEHAKAFESCYCSGNVGHSIVAIAERVEWRSDSPEPDYEYLTPGDFGRYDNARVRDSWWTITPEYRAYLLAHWDVAFAYWFKDGGERQRRTFGLDDPPPDDESEETVSVVDDGLNVSRIVTSTTKISF